MHPPHNQQQPHSSASMKENDGRGARRKYMRIAVIVASILGPLLLLAFGLKLAITTSTDGGASTTTLRGRNAQRRQRHGLLSHRSANDRDWERSVAAETNNHNEQDEADNGLQGILEGRLHLMAIRPQRHYKMNNNMQTGEYSGIVASFCHIDWSHHKEDPTTSPMFRFLLEKSPGCSNRDPYEWDLYDIVQKAKAYDDQTGNGVVHTLNLTGVVFHESRCGSTLVANLLAAMKPDKHRVYSESSPPISAMRLADSGTLSTVQAAAILKDVMYMMSRSNDPAEERVFFKIQSVGTRSMGVFQAAFPRTPWIFVYRDPVQVIMSHLGKGRPSMANCVRPQSYPPPAVERIVEKYGSGNGKSGAQDLSYQDFCAAHLASLTEAAVRYMNDYGTPVNYVDLPKIMYTDILPHRWQVPTGPDEIQRIQTVSTQYSKQGKGGKPQEFTGDSEKKEEAASPAIKQAAQRYLQPSFDELERVAKEKKL